MSHTYQVLARRYRPQLFRDVIAQTSTVTTLKNALRMKRTAHAYLFCGCRGTGKTTLARLLAKALNCTSLSEEMEPCNQCPSCRDITAGYAMDVLEMDGASQRSIEDIRQINETLHFATVGRFKIYLIDEVHMLTKEAFNALLKSLEEPPPHVKFLFCTTEPHRIPHTILSRCQQFHLQRIPTAHILTQLARVTADNKMMAESEALEILAEQSEGSLRDALTLLDQIALFEKENITTEKVYAFLGSPTQELLFSLAIAGEKREWMAAFRITQEALASGKSLSHFLEGLISHFRALLLVKNGGMLTEREKKKYEEIAPRYRTEQLLQILEILTEGEQTIKSAPSEGTALEILLLKILRTHQQVSLESLVERLLVLEKQLSTQGVICEKQEPSTPTVKCIPVEHTPPTANDIGTEKRVETGKAATSIQEQSHFDTVMRFAAKELNGILKKE